MSIFGTISIAVGLAMDCFAVSLSTGASQKKLRFTYAIKLSFFFGLFQGFMPVLGWLAGISVSNRISEFGNIISFTLLTFMGSKMIYEGVKKRGDSSLGSAEAGIRLLLVMAVATSLDALAVGVTFALAGEPSFTALLPHAGIIALVSFLFSILGAYTGAFFGKFLETKAEIAGGIVLIIIGLRILLF